MDEKNSNITLALVFFLSFFLFKDFNLLIFRERGIEGEREGEKHQWENTPNKGPGLQSRHVPFTGNQTGDPLVHRLVLNPLSHTGQD